MTEVAMLATILANTTLEEAPTMIMTKVGVDVLRAAQPVYGPVVRQVSRTRLVVDHLVNEGWFQPDDVGATEQQMFDLASRGYVRCSTRMEGWYRITQLGLIAIGQWPVDD